MSDTSRLILLEKRLRMSLEKWKWTEPQWTNKQRKIMAQRDKDPFTGRVSTIKCKTKIRSLYTQIHDIECLEIICSKWNQLILRNLIPDKCAVDVRYSLKICTLERLFSQWQHCGMSVLNEVNRSVDVLKRKRLSESQCILTEVNPSSAW